VVVNPDEFAPSDIPKVLNAGQPRDLKETKEMVAKTKNKTAGIEDIRLFAMHKDHNKYLTPAEAVITRGVRINIKDLKEEDPDELKANHAVRFTNYEVGI
jgi:hypothetical protein